MQAHIKEKTVESAFEDFIRIKKNDNLSDETINDYKNIFRYLHGVLWAKLTV